MKNYLIIFTSLLFFSSAFAGAESKELYCQSSKFTPQATKYTVKDETNPFKGKLKTHVLYQVNPDGQVVKSAPGDTSRLLNADKIMYFGLESDGKLISLYNHNRLIEFSGENIVTVNEVKMGLCIACTLIE